MFRGVFVFLLVASVQCGPSIFNMFKSDSMDSDFDKFFESFKMFKPESKVQEEPKESEEEKSEEVVTSYAVKDSDGSTKEVVESKDSKGGSKTVVSKSNGVQVVSQKGGSSASSVQAVSVSGSG